MTVTITIDCDNEAFTPDAGEEVSRLLKTICKRLYDEHIGACDGMALMDFNGNRVGTLRIGGAT